MTIERLDECPLLACHPMGRSESVCYGKNGARRACMLDEGKPLLVWTGDDAWAGPADRLRDEAPALKATA